MNDTLTYFTDQIIDAALALQHQGLNEKQEGFVKIIISNAEKFIHLAAQFQAVPLGEITADMRHDLGNPLTPIGGYGELLTMGLMGILTPEQQLHAQTIVDSTKALKEHVDDLVQQARDYTRAQSMAAAV